MTGARIKPHWTALLSALAFRRKKSSIGELFPRASQLAERVQISRLDQAPDNRSFVEWLSQIAKVSRVTISIRSTGEVLKYYFNGTDADDDSDSDDNDSARLKNDRHHLRLSCLCRGPRPTYSLLIQSPTNVFPCRRCGQISLNRNAQLRHAALCAKKNALAYQWRRKYIQMFSSKSDNVPTGKQMQRTNKLRFLPGRRYNQMATVEQQLNGLGIGTGTLFQQHYSFCCLDTEAYMPNFFTTKPHMSNTTNPRRNDLPYSNSLDFITIHELLLIVLSYRLPNETQIKTRLFWRQRGQSPEKLLCDMVHFLNTLSDKISRRLRDGDFRPLLKRIDDMAFKNANNYFLHKQIDSARKSVLRFIRRMLVITYHGARYDIPLLRRYGFLQILQELDGNEYFKILKKKTSYLAITTDKLRFIDILNFTPVKASLGVFLKCFGITQEEGKQTFPHGCVKRLSDINKPITSITYSDFHDVLSAKNTLAEPYLRYCRLRRDGSDEKAALKHLNLESRPLSGPSAFHRLMAYWNSKGYLSIRDVMADYAKHDTMPLYRATIGFMAAFEQLWLGDLLHSCVSLAQTSLSYFMRNKETDESFALVSEEIYCSMRELMVGGPAIVYRRIAEPNKGGRCREWELGPKRSEPVRGLTSLGPYL